jgi:D-lactate dehydrogenase (cytochrome)
MELLDGFTMKAVNQAGYCSREFPEKPSLFIKIAGPSSDHVQDTAKTAERIAEASGALSFSLAQDEEEASSIWAARKTALWSLLACKRHPDDKFLSADACVPISSLGTIIPAVQAKIDEAGLLGSFLGHVGDGETTRACKSSQAILIAHRQLPYHSAVFSTRER